MVNETNATSETRVLVVDDDVDICANIRDILVDLGYHVDVAHDGPAALQLIEHSRYDVAVLDFKMAGMDGATLYAEIKRLRPEIVAIMVTAYAGSTGAQRALAAGTWKVLRKPVDIRSLVSLVEQVAESPTVLIVDDDHDFCQTLWQVLRDNGYRVAIASSEQQGLEQALDGDFQIALVDLHLGPGDGRSVLEFIHRTRPTATTVVVTGHHHEAKKLSDSSQDKSVICLKPLDLPKLLDVIRPT